MRGSRIIYRFLYKGINSQLLKSCLLLGALFFQLTPQFLHANPDIIIGLTPNEAVPKLKELEAELAKRLGDKVVLFIGKNYEDLRLAFEKGTLSFAIVPPRVAVKLEKTTPLRYLLKKVYGQSEYYYSAIVAQSKSPFKKLKQLKGKKIGFVDQESASGYLYPKLMLEQAGLAGSYEESFWGTHEKALEALKEKKVDAVGVWADEPSSKNGAWTKMGENTKDYRVLDYSEPIPNDPLIVREDFYKKAPSTVLRLMEVLLALSEETTLVKEITGADKLTTATKTHFESVRQLEEKSKQ